MVLIGDRFTIRPNQHWLTWNLIYVSPVYPRIINKLTNIANHLFWLPVLPFRGLLGLTRQAISVRTIHYCGYSIYHTSDSLPKVEDLTRTSYSDERTLMPKSGQSERFRIRRSVPNDHRMQHCGDYFLKRLNRDDGVDES